MREMFSGCTALESITFGPLFKTDNVTDMDRMFADCSSLQSLDLSSFNTRNVEKMSNMFYGCSALDSLNVTGLNTANVTEMQRMFYGCSAITELDLDNFSTAKLTKTFNMFDGCSALKTIWCHNDWSSIANGNEMFIGCTALVGGNGTTCDGTTNINSAYAHLDESGNPGYFSKKTTTALDQITNDQSPITNKVLIDGQLYILRDGKMYSMQGQEVK